MMSRLQRLRRVAAKQRQIISMPEQVAMDQMQLTRSTSELEDKLMRDPSDDELANHTGLSMKRIQYIRTGVRPVAESTITRMGPEGIGGFDPSVRGLAQGTDSWAELVYSDIEPTNQFIMENVLGMHGHEPMAPSKVAARLKISPAAVSHRMAKIQQKLDRRDELETF
jgi:DNA-directed RNA polymerase specialized sigma subunit